MIKVYLLHHGQHLLTNWDKEIDEIKTLNVDKIICDCLDEQEWTQLFGVFLPKILPWAKENNKVIQVIAPDVGSVVIENVEVYTSVSLMMTYFPETNKWIRDSYEYGLEDNHIVDRYPRVQSPLLYTCYNRNGSYARKKMIDTLARENLLEHGIVTCHFVDPHGWNHHDGTSLFDPLEPEFEFRARPEFGPAALPKSFFKGFFDIVTESRQEPNELMITEKTLKSIINYKPFLVLSCKGYHKEYLSKRFGYQLYDEMFDYSFDSCDSVDDRIEGIVENVKRLRDLLTSDESKLNMLASISRKLRFNRAQYFDILHDPDKLIPECLQFVRETDDYKFYGHLNTPLIRHMKKMNWIKL